MSKDTVNFDEAIAMLPVGDEIHTFRGRTGILVGAYWGREDLISALREADEIWLSGPNMEKMKHGLAIDKDGWLFIATQEREQC